MPGKEGRFIAFCFMAPPCSCSLNKNYFIIVHWSLNCTHLIYLIGAGSVEHSAFFTWEFTFLKHQCEPNIIKWLCWIVPSFLFSHFFTYMSYNISLPLGLAWIQSPALMEFTMLCRQILRNSIWQCSRANHADVYSAYHLLAVGLGTVISFCKVFLALSVKYDIKTVLPL